MTDRIPLASVLSQDRSVIKRVGERVAGGEVLVYPTETIYGIGGRADSAEVENRISSIKNRSKESPFILIASDLGCFSSFDISFPSNARHLAAKFWPGNLTLVLPSRTSSNGVGIRISDHPFVSSLCKEMNLPVFSTSANMSGETYAGDPDEIFRTFKGKVDLFIDAGLLPESKASTIVKINADESFEIIREGAISRQRLLQVLS